MTFAAWMEIIAGVLKFPDAILKLIRLFQKTPQEKHEEIVKLISDESAKFEKTGRPVWRK